MAASRDQRPDTKINLDKDAIRAVIHWGFCYANSDQSHILSSLITNDIISPETLLQKPQYIMMLNSK